MKQDLRSFYVEIEELITAQPHHRLDGCPEQLRAEIQQNKIDYFC